MDEGNVQLRHKRLHNEQAEACTQEAKCHNVEKQRRYMEKLKTPDKKTELMEYRQKRAERRREL